MASQELSLFLGLSRPLLEVVHEIIASLNQLSGEGKGNDLCSMFVIFCFSLFNVYFVGRELPNTSGLK